MTDRRLKISVKFSFLVFLSLIFLLKDSMVIFSFFTVCAVHEAGHGAALYLTGGRLSAMIFCGTGIRMIPDRTFMPSLKSEIAVLLAGPFANIVLFLILNPLNGGNSFAQLSLCAGLFNLLPYSILDGGAVLSLLIMQSRYERIFLHLLTVLRLGAIIGSACAAAAFGKEYIPLLCAAVFYFAAEFFPA